LHKIYTPRSWGNHIVFCRRNCFWGGERRECKTINIACGGGDLLYFEFSKKWAIKIHTERNAMETEQNINKDTQAKSDKIMKPESGKATREQKKNEKREPASAKESGERFGSGTPYKNSATKRGKFLPNP